MSEHFNTVVNFIICKNLTILKIAENKNPTFESFNHPKPGKQTPIWISLKFKIYL